MKLPRFTVLGLFFICLPFGTLSAAGSSDDGDDSNVVNVYTHRHYDSDAELYKRFTAETGIKVNIVRAGADELVERLRSEGPDSPADLLITVDVGRMYRARKLNLLQPVKSPTLESQIPAALRDPESYWIGLTQRARVIVYDTSRRSIRPMDYEDLASDGLDGSVLIRSSSNIYNISLLASIVVNDGEEAARAWAKGVVANMARKPQGNDRDQMKALAAGIGDYAVVNTYYVGLLLNSDDPAEREIGEKIGIIFPNQDNRGTHVNISGGGVTANAPHKKNAIRLLEFLSSPPAQRVYSSVNFEYPVNTSVNTDGVVASWGKFKADTLNVEKIGEASPTAQRIFNEVGWD